MISVIVYGRNDAHGYNLHRRVALSLNCLAEVLTDPDDEIVFVDYNTPDELPTLVEALSDTLTDRCLGLLRVLRIRAAIHKERFAPRTHLSVAEPVARNAAARRANPSNRWLLSTNTDMVFLPLEEESLSEICGDLQDGFYGLPRFELPEWLWEQLPRTEPREALAEISRLGPDLRLDEPTVSHDWIRFDAPGDFQLVLRDEFFAIDGFDEEMLLGYHVDSNLSRRMLLHGGSIETLDDRLSAYHCNHNRVPTVYHDARPVTNDLDRFFFSIDRAELPAQRTTMGLAGVPLEEVPIRRRVGIEFAAALIGAIPNGPPGVPSQAYGAPFELTYDSGHVLPFIADSLAVSPRDARVAYLGANPMLERMLSTVIAELGLERPLAVAEPDDPESLRRIIQSTDVFIVDFGLDVSLVDIPLDATDRFASGPVREKLDPIFAALEQLVSIERARLEHGEHPRRIVLVNSTSGFWNEYVLSQLDCSYTTIHSRVRRATVRPLPDEDAPTMRSMLLSPMESAVVEIYRRRPIFKAIVNSLIRVGAAMTRAARLGRPPRRLVEEAPVEGQTDVWDGPSPGLPVTREPRARVRDT